MLFKFENSLLMRYGAVGGVVASLPLMNSINKSESVFSRQAMLSTLIIVTNGNMLD